MLRTSNVANRSFASYLAEIVPLLLGVTLMLTNRWFPPVDDECAIIDRAARPLAYTLNLFLTGKGEHEHPPLYDLILHGWLRLTGGEMHLLRLPAVVFYVLGAWVLALAAKRLGGNSARVWVLVLVAIWPFGFHFGRVAGWYSFCFLLVSLLTLGYLVYVDRPTLTNWAWVLACALLLIYSNYFGWALLFFLAVDLMLRNQECLAVEGKRVVAGITLLVLAYLPVLVAFLKEIHGHVRVPHSVASILANGTYNLYCIFVSESVAPWFWAWGFTAGICIFFVLMVSLWCRSRPAQRFLAYFICLLALMTILGILETKRLMLIAPWLILAIGVMIGAWSKGYWARRVCIVGLSFIALIGWYGIFARDLYAAPHWIEPWNDVAREATNVVGEGGIIIGNNPSFFFYLTYSLRSNGQREKVPYFSGFLPVSVHHRGVYSPEQWLAAGAPLAPTMLFVKGLHYPTQPSLEEAEHFLSEGCTLLNRQQMVYDAGAGWKQRFAPTLGQVPWRIHVSRYHCEGAIHAR